jgi:hypothetical protein
MTTNHESIESIDLNKSRLIAVTGDLKHIFIPSRVYEIGGIAVRWVESTLDSGEWTHSFAPIAYPHPNQLRIKPLSVQHTHIEGHSK